MRFLAMFAVFGLLATGCAKTPSNGELTVVAAFYPLAYAAQEVVGTNARVVSLTPPGVEPHDLELSAADVELISSADLVVYIPGFQPAVDEAIAQQAPDAALSALEGIEVITDPDGAQDPHVWLNPLNEATIATNIASRLTEMEPGKGASFTAANETFTSAMNALNDEYVAGLGNCDTRTMVVSHDAFGYLAAAYNLKQVGVAGLSPDAEPSPARLAEVAAVVANEHVTTIYSETLVDPKVAQTLAATTGVSTAVLDPIEGLVEGSTQTYPSLMKSNLQTLRTGQGCQ